MYELLLILVENGQAGRKDDLGDREMANEAVVVLLVMGIQNGVGEGVVRHGNTVQRTDDIFNGLPVMVVEGFGAGHAAEGHKQHPCDYLSQTRSHFRAAKI